VAVVDIIFCEVLESLYAGSIGHPPHSSASPVELRLRVGPRQWKKKKNLEGVKNVVPLSVCDGLKGKKLLK